MLKSNEHQHLKIEHSHTHHYLLETITQSQNMDITHKRFSLKGTLHAQLSPIKPSQPARKQETKHHQNIRTS